MEDSLIQQGLQLMLYGMGTVLVFLTLLVLVTAGMSRLVRRLASPPGDSAPERAAPADPTLLAAIAAAIGKHRKRRGQ